MYIDVVIEQPKGLLFIFEKYKEGGFVSAMISSKKIVSEMNIEHKFYDKCIICKKK